MKEVVKLWRKMCLQLPARAVTRAPFDISYLISEVQNKEGFFCSWCIVIMAQILSGNKSSEPPPHHLHWHHYRCSVRWKEHPSLSS